MLFMLRVYYSLIIRALLQGGSRGLEIAIVEEYAKNGASVYAVCKSDL